MAQMVNDAYLTASVGERTYRVIRSWLKWPAWIEAGTRDMAGPERDPVSTRLLGGFIAAVAVDSQDRVYVARRPDPPIVVFDRDGNYVHSWGNGTMVFPHAIHIANEMVYVTDKDAQVCNVFSLDGKPIQMLGRHGVRSGSGADYDGVAPYAAGPFDDPAKLVSSPWGDLYVADGHRNCRIHRFDSGGHLIQSWGRGGKTGPGVFHQPHSVLATRGGRIYVCDKYNNRIQIFTSDGEFITTWGGVMLPADICQIPGGDFAVSCSNKTSGRDPSASNFDISFLDQHGALLGRLDARGSHGLSVDSRGAIYNALMYVNNVDKYVPSDA